MSSIQHDWLKFWSQHAADRPALTDGLTLESWSYSDFYKHAQSGAAYLEARGLKKGDRVLYVGQSSLSVLALFFATSRIGAILVPVNYRFTQVELSYVIQNSEPKIVFHDFEYLNLTNDGLKDSGIDCQVLNLEVFARACLSAAEYPQFHAEESDPVLIIYTSGTTGKPKGAMLTYRGLFWNAVSTGLRLNISQQDTAITFLPLFHTGGWNVLTTPFIFKGAHIILTQKFAAEQILLLTEKFKCSLLFGVPTTMSLLAQSASFDTAELGSLRYAIVGGEPMSLELINIWHKRGICIRQGYGLTEFGPNVFSLSEKEAVRKIGSIGFPNAYIEVRVVTESLQEAEVGQVGELWLRGPACMLGYWRNSQATDQAIQEGWLKTGDLVKFDYEGFFYVVGRKKEMYKSGGENIYPAEIELVISQITWVREVAVVGRPDEKWGETGVAYISSDRESFDAEQLREHCSKKLAKFKIPIAFYWMPELPKTGAGKILKRELGTLR